MSGSRRTIARIVESHLVEILDRTMAAFVDELASVRALGPRGRARIRAATRQTAMAFLGLYADPASPAREQFENARRATVDRAGEVFDREDIVAMLRIGRHVMLSCAREFVSAEMELDPDRAAEIETALSMFMDELERTEQLVSPADDAVHQLLASAEDEEADLG